MLFEYESLLRSYKSHRGRKQTMRLNRQYFCLLNPRLCLGFILSPETWMFSRMRQRKTTAKYLWASLCFLRATWEFSWIYHSLCLEAGVEGTERVTNAKRLGENIRGQTAEGRIKGGTAMWRRLWSGPVQLTVCSHILNPTIRAFFLSFLLIGLDYFWCEELGS